MDVDSTEDLNGTPKVYDLVNCGSCSAADWGGFGGSSNRGLSETLLDCCKALRIGTQSLEGRYLSSYESSFDDAAPDWAAFYSY